MHRLNQQLTGEELTNKFWCSKDILELISSFYLMCNSKINKLDSRVGDIFVQQHDVFRLEDKMALCGQTYSDREAQMRAQALKVQYLILAKGC